MKIQQNKTPLLCLLFGRLSKPVSSSCISYDTASLILHFSSMQYSSCTSFAACLPCLKRANAVLCIWLFSYGLAQWQYPLNRQMDRCLNELCARPVISCGKGVTRLARCNVCVGFFFPIYFCGRDFDLFYPVPSTFLRNKICIQLCSCKQLQIVHVWIQS